MSFRFSSRSALTFSAFCSLLVVSSASGADTRCFDSAVTQNDLNGCASSDFAEADAELNRVYRRVREVYADEPEFLEKLRIAQGAWIKLRDADAALKFPHTDDDPRLHYGSVFPMCHAGERAQLTRARTAFLKRWIDGVEEGDVCAGSSRLRP